jgi:hypothetical protein
MIFYPRNTRKARKYPYSCQDSIDTKMTLTLECRLRLPWQAKLALPSLPASKVGLNKLIRAIARISVSGKHLIKAYLAKNTDLVKILGTTFLIFFVSFVPFVEKLLF